MKLIFKLINWSKSSGSKLTFCFIFWKWYTLKKLQAVHFSDCRNQRLQCYNWWKNFFWSASKNDLITYKNIQKTATGQGDDCTTDCFLDYNYFNKHYKIIVIDVNKQQALDTDPKAIQ